MLRSGSQRALRSTAGVICARCRTPSRLPRIAATLTPKSLLLPNTRNIRTSSTSSQSSREISIQGKTFPTDTYTNVTPTILSKIGRNLHQNPSHPIGILKSIIESHFSNHTSIVPPTPIVSVYQNFDELGFSPDHPGRNVTDSYYFNKDTLLRTHTSAHEVETYKKGFSKWLLSADVYRRDEIDNSHYPVFHQMEGTSIWRSSSGEDLETIQKENEMMKKELEKCNLIIEDTTAVGPSNPYQQSHDPKVADAMTQHLKHSLNGLIFRLFGQAAASLAETKGEPLRVRWIEAFFPFTTPSYEVEVWWNGEWLELLGCGVVMQKTLEQAGVPEYSGWAFGLGLERIAMVLFSIPDIRLFWSEDPRFLNQFSPGKITSFKAYSKYPPCYKDMSFWLPPASSSAQGESKKTVVDPMGASAAGGLLTSLDSPAEVEAMKLEKKGMKVFHENDYCEIVREVAGDLVEGVTLIDEFKHPKSGRQSKAYRINYRSMDRSLSNDEVNALQAEVIERVVKEMGVEIR